MVEIWKSHQATSSENSTTSNPINASSGSAQEEFKIQHRHEQDRKALQAAFAKRLHADVAHMYNSRCYSDGQIVTRKGSIEFHQALVAARCPNVWAELQELVQLQELTGLQKVASLSINDSTNLSNPTGRQWKCEAVFTVHLPDIQNHIIEQFVVSVYENRELQEVKAFNKAIQERKEWLKQLCELKRRRIPLQPIEHSTSQHVHKQIWEQLQEERVQQRVHLESEQLHPTKRSRKFNPTTCLEPSIILQPHTVTFQSLHKKKQKAFVEKKIQQSLSCTSVYINYKDPVKYFSDPQKDNLKSSIEIVDLDAYLHLNENSSKKRSNTTTIKQNVKRPRMRTKATAAVISSSSSHAIQNTSHLSKDPTLSKKCHNSVFFLGPNMKMEEAVKTETDTTFSESENKNLAVNDDEINPDDLGGDGSITAGHVHMRASPHHIADPCTRDNCVANPDIPENDDSAFCTDVEEPENIAIFPSVKAKVKRLENISKNIYLPTEGKFTRSQSCSEPPLAVVTPNRFSVSSDPNSNQVEAALTSTSSLEVELDSSNVFSESDAQDSESFVTEKTKSVISKELHQNIESTKKVLPHKPLVRTRTFEIIDSKAVTGSVNNNGEEASQIQHVLPSSVQQSRAREAKQYDAELPTNHSRHAVVAHQPQQEPVDPDRVRERERQQGSLLFEHNFQTFSSIPTTNMMTATMMTGSLSSESSIGLGSLFSSMVDSAVISSVQSMSSSGTGAEPSLADSISRPPSVALSNVTCDEDVCFDPNPASHISAALRKGSFGNSLNSIEDRVTKEVRESKTLSKVSDSSSRSASPDSLSVEQRGRIISSSNDHPDTDSLMSTRQDMKCSGDSSVSGNKEDLDSEEKEQDDLDVSDPNTVSEKTLLTECASSGADRPFFQVSSELSSFSGSPRIIRRAEHIPIVSGGSTLKRELSTEGAKFERQGSTNAVKDVDAIPLVCGFIAESDPQEKSVDIKCKPEAQSQPIFSMFIDFNELPSPAEEKKAGRLPVEHPTPQSVYMFIDAEYPSPKTKRKTEPAHEQSRTSVVNKGVTGGNTIPALHDTLSDPLKISNGYAEAKDVTKLQHNTTDLFQNGCKNTPEKKSFFMFIEADPSSTAGSPKTKRKPVLTPKKPSREPPSIMSKSAPSDVLLMATKSQAPEKLCSKPIIDGDELMTKSVIDRKEYMEQPVTKRNVSLNDRINESSATPRNIREGFISAIPRPIHLLKCKSSSKVPVRMDARSRSEYPRLRLQDTDGDRPSDGNAPQPQPEERSVGQTVGIEYNLELTELCVSLTDSLGEVATLSLPLDDASTTSDVSSLLDAIHRTRTPGSGTSNSSSRLGDDLLRMFEEEINADVVVQVGSKQMKAHKCILASRCVYFAAMLAGRWRDKPGNVLKLQGFSASSVLLALRHIYSGEAPIVDGGSAEEIAALADMLALDGLKEAVALYLKAERCHYFHKPCVGGCIEGVLETLVMCSAYSLDELHGRCLRWLGRHFAAVLPTKQFALLPDHLQQRCLKQMIYDMSISSVLETVVGSSRVLSSLPVVRWAQPTFSFATHLLEAATSFMADNLSAVLDTDKFLVVCGGLSISPGVEDALLSACQQLTAPDQAVLAHVQLTKLMHEARERRDSAGDEGEALEPLLQKLLIEVESFLIQHASRASVCRQWPLLPVSVQRRIKQAAPTALHLSGGRYGGGGVVAVHQQQPHRPRLGSLGSKVPSADLRLSRSASASVVPPALQHSPARQFCPAQGGLDPIPRLRVRSNPGVPSRLAMSVPPLQRARPVSLSTPPPTRASTLRARQAALVRGGKTSDGSSADESRSPRPPQRHSSRPHTPSSRPTSRPLTPAHHTTRMAALSTGHSNRRNSFTSRSASQASESSPDTRANRTMVTQLNNTNNNKMMNGSNASQDQQDPTVQRLPESNQPVDNKDAVPGVPHPDPPPPAQRSRTFLKEERS